MKRIKRNQTLNLEQDGARIGIIIYNLRVETRIRGDRTQSWDMDKFQGIHRYLGIQISGYPGIWVYKYLGIQVSGYPSIWVSKYLGIQVSEYPGIWVCIFVFRYLDIQVSGIQVSGIQVSGYPGIQVSGYQAVLVSRYFEIHLGIPATAYFWYLHMLVSRYPGTQISNYLCIQISRYPSIYQYLGFIFKEKDLDK